MIKSFLVTNGFILIAAFAPVNVEPAYATCTVNSGPSTYCTVDFTVNQDLGVVDFNIPGGLISFKGNVDRNKLKVVALEVNKTAYSTVEGECIVASGHVLCSTRIGTSSLVVEAKR